MSGSDDSELWRIAGEDGRAEPMDEWELVSSLASQTLPPETLVWRRGWAEWIPACEVEELQSAVPVEKRRAPRMPQGQRKSLGPPPLPARRTGALPPPKPKSVPFETARSFGTKPPKYEPPKPPGARAPLPAPKPPEADAPKPRFGPNASDPDLSGRAGTHEPTRGAILPQPPFDGRSSPLPPARRPLDTLAEEPSLRRAAISAPPPSGDGDAPRSTFSDADSPATTTIRPPGAVPPPPRAVPPAQPKAGLISVPPTDTPVPEVPPSQAETVRGSAATRQVLTRAGSAAATPVDPEAPTRAQGYADFDTTTESHGAERASHGAERAVRDHAPRLVELRALPDAHDSTLPTASGLTGLALRDGGRKPWALYALAASTVILALGLIWLTVQRTPAPAAERPVPSASANPAAPEPCRQEGRAQKLADSIAMSVPITVSATADGRAAVGYAATPTEAVGLTVDPKTLDAARAYTKSGQAEITAVVPITQGKSLKFHADRVGDVLNHARTLNQDPLVTVGTAIAGFAQWTRGVKPKVVWPGAGETPITTPRTALAGKHHAITFRRGGREGDVLFGWMGSDGSAQSPLQIVEAPGEFRGTPNVSGNDREVLLAFAYRSSHSEAWSIAAARAPHGQLPTKARPVAATATAEGVSAISPEAAGLSGGRWLFQWTEGKSGSYRVRAATLDASLEPMGPVMELSPGGLNAGQGVVWHHQGRGLVLFIVSEGQRHELWGTGLVCPL